MFSLNEYMFNYLGSMGSDMKNYIEIMLQNATQQVVDLKEPLSVHIRYKIISEKKQTSTNGILLPTEKKTNLY
jgi:hypothetical protein